MNRICVFCGSSPGANPAYIEGARRLGRVLARAGIGLVYGGTHVGMMGAMADAALAPGGEVIGVIPRMLWEREVAHAGLTELYVVDSMHERKAQMAGLADGFITLPGGIGTMDELFEMWTWSVLGLHAKPCGFLDIAGYFAPLLAFLDQMLADGFLRPEYRSIVLADTEPERLLAQLGAYQPPAPRR